MRHTATECSIHLSEGLSEKWPKWLPIYNDRMVMKITRRELAAVLGTAVATTTPAETQAQETQSTASLAAEARAELAMDIQQIAKFPLPAIAEPAFIFEP